jgi:hypothetical protein
MAVAALVQGHQPSRPDPVSFAGEVKMVRTKIEMLQKTPVIEFLNL